MENVRIVRRFLVNLKADGEEWHNWDIVGLFICWLGSWHRMRVRHGCRLPTEKKLVTGLYMEMEPNFIFQPRADDSLVYGKVYSSIPSSMGGNW